VEGPSILI